MKVFAGLQRRGQGAGDDLQLPVGQVGDQKPGHFLHCGAGVQGNGVDTPAQVHGFRGNALLLLLKYIAPAHREIVPLVRQNGKAPLPEDLPPLLHFNEISSDRGFGYLKLLCQL